MDVKQKTALISTLLNLLLTIGKFILAGLSGSLVILAEAWHSLTDVVTSLLVYFSVSPGRGGKEEAEPGEPETPRESGTGIDWNNITIEKWMSLAIGCIILAAAWGVAHKILYTPVRDIPSPFLYGIFFILFAFCSFIVSIFEIKIGKKYNSSALIADGLHSKADMVGSLIAGFSMIALQLGIDQLGINIDKIGAVVIIIFILSFSLETFVNFWWSLHGKQGWKDRVAFGLVAAAFNRQTWNRGLRRVSRIINWDHLSIKIRSRLRRSFISILTLGVLIFILLNCLTIIGPAQQGIRERLGRLVNRGEPLEPGLHLKLPWPWEKITKVNSRTIRSMNIGNTADPQSFALLWTMKHGTEESFLSAENYFFYPYLKIHYRIKDIFDYTYSFQKPEELLDNATHRLATKIFSTRVFTDIATAYRGPMEEQIRETIQAEMDELKTGLEIITINTKDIHPPVSVADSFEQVIAAMQEKEQKINQALGYSNSSIPEARGWAVKTEKQADSYVLEKKEQSKGEASRFLNRLAGIQSNPAITRPMLYREAIKETLANKPIIIVDPDASVPEIWLKTGRPVFLDSQF